jgi:hypothetical protein
MNILWHIVFIQLLSGQMMVYQKKIVPPGSLPVLASEPPDVLLSQPTRPWMLVWIATVAVIFGLIGAPLIHLIR